MQLSGVEEGLGRILTEIVTTETSGVAGVKVVGASDIETMLGFEQEKQLLGCEENIACMAEIGGALGVELLLVSDLGLVGETYVLNLKLIDTRSVLVKKRVYKTVSGKADDLIEAVRRAIGELLLELVPAGAAAAGRREPTAESSPAQAPAQPPSPVVTERPQIWLRWAVIGVGGLAIGLAGLTELMAKMDYDRGWDSVSARDYELHPPEARDRMNNADDLSQIALFVGLAGAAVTAAGITWLALTPSDSEPSATVAPVVSGDTAGFVVDCSF
jgi:hypothetical protein